MAMGNSRIGYGEKSHLLRPYVYVHLLGRSMIRLGEQSEGGDAFSCDFPVLEGVSLRLWTAT